MSWKRVSPSKPCAVCGGSSWCTYTADGVVHCMRAKSDKPCFDKRGEASGYIHTPNGAVRRQIADKAPEPEERRPTVNWRLLQQRFFSAGFDRFDRFAELSATIGVSPTSLRLYGAGLRNADPADPCMTFPMYGPNEEICGIRTRDSLTREKRAIKGSRQGLFLPCHPFGTGYGWVCEGPTDAASLADCGRYAIGRPACQGCERQVAHYLRARNWPAVIVLDNDANKRASDAVKIGLDRLVEALRGLDVKFTLVRPPKKFKDVRGWLLGSRTTLVAAATKAERSLKC